MDRAAHRHPPALYRRPGETTSSLALKAARRRLRSGGLEAADIDLVIVATSTPDYTFPAVATQVQAALGIVEGAAFDLQAVCTGFVYAVMTAENSCVRARTSARW